MKYGWTIGTALWLVTACSNTTTTTGAGLPDAKGTLPDGYVLKDGEALPDDATGAGDDTGSTKDTQTGFTCTDGEIACFNATTSKVCIDSAWQLKDKCAEGQTCQDGNCVTPVDCTPDAIIGCDGFGTEVRCSADGKSTFMKACDPGLLCADGFCRKTVCTPYSPECVDAQHIHTCNTDGQAWGDTVDCKPGAQCFGGKCVSLCETNLKITSNVGCEYWSVDLDNYPDPFSATKPEMIPHSVVISNPGMFDANITFEVNVTCPGGQPCNPSGACTGGKACDVPATKPYALVTADPVVKAGQTKEFKMPVMNVSGTSSMPKGIHVKSDQPIMAWQFNPFNAQGAASNDGSLLLPQNVLGQQYFPVSRPSGVAMMGGLPAQSGYVTIVAAWPGTTTVSVTPSANVSASKQTGVGPFPKGKVTTVSLEQYQVLNLQAAEAQIMTGGNDLTGTFIEADKPISVFGGHQEDVESYDGTTDDSCCAEHIEEQFMPLEQWGKTVNCVKTKPRGSEPDKWIVIAGEANVTLSTVPSIKGLDGVTLKNPGDHVEVQTPLSFNLTGTGKVQATQIIVSRGVTSTFTGDPSMQIVPSPKHYRMDYGILTAQGYTDNYATVVRPAGLQVLLDGTAIPDTEFSSFGDGKYEYAYVVFKTGGHQFNATSEFGLQVYGYGNATAYSYPGGMNLAGNGKSTP